MSRTEKYMDYLIRRMHFNAARDITTLLYLEYPWVRICNRPPFDTSREQALSFRKLAYDFPKRKDIETRAALFGFSPGITMTANTAIGEEHYDQKIIWASVESRGITQVLTLRWPVGNKDV